eukprot:1159829-Pelagomonas_calceolata.AAC.3
MIYFPYLEDALKSHMHAKHRLGYADHKAGYYTYNQSLLPHANKALAMPSGTYTVSQPVSNVQSSNIAQAPTTTKNMRYASKNPLTFYAPFQDVPVWIMFSISSQVANAPISVTYVEHGSVNRLAQQDLHITGQASNRVIPPYLFDPSIPDQARCTSSPPDAILVTLCPANPNRPLIHPSHWVLHSIDADSADSARVLVVEGLELQSFSYHPALILVAGPVFSLCLPCFSQSELRGGAVIRKKHNKEHVQQYRQADPL